MAKLNRGFNQVALNGSVGAVTYVYRKGTTIAKQKVPPKVKAKQTPSLMATRMRWANLVRMWQALNSVGWHPSFKSVEGLQSDYNAFVKRNFSRGPVYLPKDVVLQGGGVVGPAQVTEGELASIGGSMVSGVFTSTIDMGGMDIGASTTLQTFSQTIIEENPDWQNGDQLTLVVLRQGGSLTAPVIVPEIHEITLNTEDTETLLGDIVDANYLDASNGRLAVGGTIVGGACFVHSRETAGGTIVSTEMLALANTDTLNRYQGGTAFENAVNSYGGFATSQYLTPNINQDLAAD